MQLPGITTIKPDQTQAINDLAHTMGISFLEEPWTAVWLDALDEIGATEARKLEISRAIMRYDMSIASQHTAVYALDDMTALAGGYLKSDLGDITWESLEDKALGLMYEEFLTDVERPILAKRARAMDPISDFGWMEPLSDGKDFIHFYTLAVDPNARGTGSFRRLMMPFFEYADAHDICCYLECYSTHLVGLYGHFGFKVINELTDPGFDMIEYCMVREPERGVQ